MATPRRFLKLSEIQAQNTPLEQVGLGLNLRAFFEQHEVKTAESLYGFMLGSAARARLLIQNLGGDYDAIKLSAASVIGIDKAKKIEAQPTTEYGTGAL